MANALKSAWVRRTTLPLLMFDKSHLQAGINVSRFVQEFKKEFLHGPVPGQPHITISVVLSSHCLQLTSIHRCLNMLVRPGATLSPSP